MLRKALLVIVSLVFFFGLYIFVVDDKHPLPVLIWGAVAFVLILGEQWRYQKKDTVSFDDWHQTDEQFIDPATDKPMRVYYNSATGERRYVSEEDDANSVN